MDAAAVHVRSRRHRPRQAKIAKPTQLARELARLARQLRRLVYKQLTEAPEQEPLHRLCDACKRTLVADQTQAEFADAVAQTLTYGLLTARWLGNAPRARFTRQAALQYLPAASPFLNDLFVSVLSAPSDTTTTCGPWLRTVDDIAELLDASDVTSIFGLCAGPSISCVGPCESGEPSELNEPREPSERNPDATHDPVIHFYEPFLAAYNKTLKNKRGVYFTPRPVVSYIVRSVHELLQREFGLRDGLASTDTWGDVAERVAGLETPRGVSASDPFVCILDPATGTGTFLVACIDVIEHTLKTRWCDELGLGRARTHWEDPRVLARWQNYIADSLLPRLYGYELMLASYAVAQLTLAFKLAQTSVALSSQTVQRRLHIYLTNSLESSTTLTTEPTSVPAELAAEAQAVAIVKQQRCFTVVLGNPPYANYSANLSDEARAWVDPYRTFAGSVIRERNQLQFERNLQDDFVKFIALGEQALRRTGVGVLGYVTSATLLTSASLRGLREQLSSSFTRLYTLHLHGGAHDIAEASRDDQNVFDITQAVSIHLYVLGPTPQPADHGFAELWGSRSKKYAFLETHSLGSTAFCRVTPGEDKDKCAFIPQQAPTGHVRVRLDDAFEQFGAGVKTNRDAIAIAWTERALVENIQGLSPELAALGDRCVRPILYRPFDERVIFYHEDVVASRSLPTMQHVLAGANLGLIAASTWTSPERFSVHVSKCMVEMKTGTHDRGTTYFPLYRYENAGTDALCKVDNFKPSFRAAWERFTVERWLRDPQAGEGDLTVSDPQHIFAWIYGICHSWKYRWRQRSLLAQGFPLILFPQSRGLLTEVVELGQRLLDLHCFERDPDTLPTACMGERARVVGKVHYANGAVWIDKSQSCGFVGVTEDVWACRIGGYRVCEKWLKDRKGRPLSEREIACYARMIGVLQETLRLMGEVDRVIERHGGWPDAFLAESQPNESS